MITEEELAANIFSQSFFSMRDKRLVIYGIGAYAKYIITHCSEYNIIGLTDETRSGGTIYGKKILTLEQIRSMNADAIIIAARSVNTAIICRRIAEFCKENSIEVYDIHGRLLSNKAGELKSFEHYQSITAKSLREKTALADVISFDIFDTLIMRNTLYPEDIFEIVEYKHGAEYKGLYAGNRFKTEHELYTQGKNPSIHKIYDRLQKILNISDNSKEALKNIEIETESEYIIPRKAVSDALQYALSLGKEVYLTSDMYFPATVMYDILVSAGIQIPVRNILVSCDHGFGKEKGLFEVLKNRNRGKKILHIGDNFDADIIAAKQYKIDDVFHINSSVKMLEDSYAAQLLEHNNNLANRLMTGAFISRQLNNPFLFSDSEGRFVIESNYDIGYSFAAPVIFCFYNWMVKKTRELKLDRILLAARDGYVFNQIYEICKDEAANLPKMQYFYTSRASAVLAGISSDEDIITAARVTYSGSPEDLLKTRFRLEDNDVEKYSGGDIADYALLHKDAIKRRAGTIKRGYLKYIDSLQINPGERVGFVDFVSSGTTQKGLAEIVDFNLFGLYFARVYGEDKQDTNIEAMYATAYGFDNKYNLLNNHFLLENILSSFEPALKGFDGNGSKIFFPETRTEKQLLSLKEIHQGIYDYFRDTHMHTDILKDAAIDIPDLFIKFLNSKYSACKTDYFETETQTDEFCNRVIKITG